MGAYRKIIVSFFIVIVYMGIIKHYFTRFPKTIHPEMMTGYNRGQYLKRWYGKYVSSLYEKEETQFHQFLIKHIGLKTVTDKDKMMNNSTPVTDFARRNYIKYDRKPINMTRFGRLNKVGYSKCKFELQLVRTPHNNAPNTVIYKICETEEIGNATKGTYKLRRESCSDGGSLFRAITEGPYTRSFCNTQDFFNGTYQLTCRVYEDNTLIKVTLDSSNFLIYAQIFVKPVELFHQKMPNPYEDYALQLNRRENGILGEYDMLAKFNGEYNFPTYFNSIWVKTNSTKSGMTIAGKHWDLLFQGCPLLSMSNGTLRHCLDKFNNVILLGDSHIRYGLFYLLHKLGKLDPHVPMVLRRTYTFKQFIFKWATWPKLVAGEIKNIDKNLHQLGHNLSRSTTKPDLIIINCGHWDFNTRNIIEYVKGMEVAFEVLEEFMIRRKELVRVIWMGLFPTMDHPPFSINGWLYGRLARIGVEPFDTASIIYPFYEQRVCHLHYMCINPKTGSISGNVGPIAYDALYNYMCQ